MRAPIVLVVGIAVGGVAGFFVGAGARAAVAKSPVGGGRDVPLSDAAAPVPGAPPGAVRPLARRDSEPAGANDGAAAPPADPAAADGTATAAAAETPLLDNATRGELADLREKLKTACSAERTRLLQEALRRASSGTPAQRAAILAEIFKSDGWFKEKAGPAFDDAVWNLSSRTLKELPAGRERDQLQALLSEQMERARGVDALSEMLSLVRSNVADERARLEQRAGAPSDSAVRALRDLLCGSVDADPDGLDMGLLSSTAFGLGGASASADDRATLMALADRARAPSARLAGLAALGSTPDDGTVDTFLARIGQDGRRPWSERAVAWQVLRRRGREELLPASVRGEILDAWSASGAASLEQAFNR